MYKNGSQAITVAACPLPTYCSAQVKAELYNHWFCKKQKVKGRRRKSEKLIRQMEENPAACMQ